jgi:hypothetical protein
MQNIHHFALKKCPKQHGQRKFLELKKKKNPYLKEKNHEIAKIFGGF